MIMRVLRDLWQRTPTWNPLSQWVSIKRTLVIRLLILLNNDLSFNTGPAIIGRENYIVGGHTIEPWRLYATRNGSLVNWHFNQWTRRVGSM